MPIEPPVSFLANSRASVVKEKPGRRQRGSTSKPTKDSSGGPDGAVGNPAVGRYPHQKCEVVGCTDGWNRDEIALEFGVTLSAERHERRIDGELGWTRIADDG
jgi:hypothetical protein